MKYAPLFLIATPALAHENAATHVHTADPYLALLLAIAVATVVFFLWKTRT
ncbi:hypothetical protein [Loktanella sp. IMCC34160]|uniref:hypothetical protein n=1 Tax=Loktanella sp. IMCC34160 TaxID=2510646 RepID=UPI0013ECDA0C|nr:hypothetical protein [Loktanella sp. IMCC34160]